MSKSFIIYLSFHAGNLESFAFPFANTEDLHPLLFPYMLMMVFNHTNVKRP